MGGREWKPGDVASARVTTRGMKRRLVVRVNPDENLGFPWVAGDAMGGPLGGDIVHDIRPLVVIDPEDREQVERLRDLYDGAWREHHGYDLERNYKGQRGNAIQTALRALLEPPRPEEPKGFGAIVEDNDGRRYVRHRDESPRWFGEHRNAFDWADIAAVRVLSPGVEQ